MFKTTAYFRCSLGVNPLYTPPLSWQRLRRYTANTPKIVRDHNGIPPTKVLELLNKRTGRHRISLQRLRVHRSSKQKQTTSHPSFDKKGTQATIKCQEDSLLPPPNICAPWWTTRKVSFTSESSSTLVTC